MTSTVLLTGATGFLGSVLAAKLLADNYEVVALKRKSSSLNRLHGLIDQIRFYDVTDYETAFQENNIFSVIHTATAYGRGCESPSTIVKANLLLPVKILESSIAHGVSVFVNTDTFFNVDYPSLRYYTLSKKQFCDWLQLSSLKLRCFNLRLFHLYGINDSDNKFIPSIVNKLLASEKEILLTPGRQKRDFLYVEDAADAYVEVLRKALDFNAGYYDYDVGSGKTESIHNLVEMLKNIIRNDVTALRFGALPMEKNEPAESRANTHPLERDFKWSANIGLREGLERTVNWLKLPKSNL